jgi:hypothetical protein
MLYRGRRYINTCFVSIFRQLFTGHPQYPWKSKRLETGIFIDESYPRGERKFPEIICTDVTDNEFFHASFDRNFQEDVYDEQGNITGSIYGITITPTIRVSISALTKYDAEIIADYICSYMNYGGINLLADAGITILSATGDAPQAEEYGKENIYTITLNFNIQAEWQKFVSPGDVIERIVIPSIDILDKKNDPTVIQQEPGIIITKESEESDESN